MLRRLLQYFTARKTLHFKNRSLFKNSQAIGTKQALKKKKLRKLFNINILLSKLCKL
jgi:hypothetical protein